MRSTAISPHTYRSSFVPAGAVTGIGSLPLISVAAAISSIAEFSPEIPFWPQLPRLSEREGAIGQGLGILGDLIETRGEGYGYQVRAGPFKRMCRAKPDILSFDAHEGLELFFADPDARNFAHRGGMVAYGMVPTLSRLTTLDSTSIFVRWLKAASSAGDPQKLARSAIITATCGLGLLDPSSAAESFRVAHGISKLIRTLAGGDDI